MAYVKLYMTEAEIENKVKETPKDSSEVIPVCNYINILHKLHY